MGHFYGPSNVRNRFSTLELLFVAPKNTFELLLSSEICQFDGEEADFIGFTLKSLLLGQREMLGFSMKKKHVLNFKLTYLGAQEEFESVLER